MEENHIKKILLWDFSGQPSCLCKQSSFLPSGLSKGNHYCKATQTSKIYVAPLGPFTLLLKGIFRLKILVFGRPKFNLNLKFLRLTRPSKTLPGKTVQKVLLWHLRRDENTCESSLRHLIRDKNSSFYRAA